MAVPARGDIIWLDFDPQSGREQAGHRPALVLSPQAYNEKVGLAVVVPITRHAKGYGFEVPLPAAAPVEGVVLSDHVRSVDWRERRAHVIGSVPEQFVLQVTGRLGRLLGPTP